MESDTVSLDSLFDDQPQAQTTKGIASTVHVNEIQPTAGTTRSALSQFAPEGQANGTQTNIEGRREKRTVSVCALLSTSKDALVEFLTGPHSQT